MKIIILGKSNQMGATPNIRIKGMSQVRYNFVWDKEIRHFAFEPENQKQIDDIFRTQGKLYKTMFFSVYLEPETKAQEEKPKTKSRKSKAKSQPVAEELAVS
jgi:hypothetical protein